MSQNNGRPETAQESFRKAFGMGPREPKDSLEVDGLCGLSVLLVFIGIIAIIAGFAGMFAMDSYTDTIIKLLCVMSGVLSGVFNFALAVIVDACDKYRKRH